MAGSGRKQRCPARPASCPRSGVSTARPDAAKWAGFLEELARCFEANGSNIIRVNPEARALTFCALYGYDAALRRLFAKD